jgi:hypothetical protein
MLSDLSLQPSKEPVLVDRTNKFTRRSVLRGSAFAASSSMLRTPPAWSNRPQRSLPFDKDYKPKPAFFAIRDAFDHRPKGAM